MEKMKEVMRMKDVVVIRKDLNARPHVLEK